MDIVFLYLKLEKAILLNNALNRYIKFKLYILQRLTLVSQFSIVQENLPFSAQTSRKTAPIRTAWQKPLRLVAYAVCTFAIYRA